MSATASVLVAYASTYGSTKEVAEALVTTLREQGVDAVAQAVARENPGAA